MHGIAASSLLHVDLNYSGFSSQSIRLSAVSPLCVVTFFFLSLLLLLLFYFFFSFHFPNTFSGGGRRGIEVVTLVLWHINKLYSLSDVVLKPYKV